MRVHNTITRFEYKDDNGDFLKVKAPMCVRGDQQIAGVSFKETDLYAPVLKAAEARLLLALAAANGNKVLKTDTKQAYLHGDMGDVVINIRPSDWWPEPIPEGHVLLKAFMEPGRRRENGMNIVRARWKGMDMLL